MPTKFQQLVWNEIEQIPYGETRSYKDIAVSIGKPRAARAVANACAKNPTPIELVVSSTDKYQGQEADIVLISLVKTRNHGFLDSWNRMNVAITRAKRKRIIFGKYANFGKAEDSMLRDLAKSHTGKALFGKEREV